MARENATSFILLGLLCHEELSGYDLKKRIDQSISLFWDIGYGQIYPTLALLESQGCLTKRKEPSSLGPDKYMYSTTPLGLQRLKEWIATTDDREYVKHEMLLKLFFGGQADEPDNQARIEAFKIRHELELARLAHFHNELEPIIETSPDHLYYYLSVRFGEFLNDAYIAWAEEAQSIIKEYVYPEISHPKRTSGK